MMLPNAYKILRANASLVTLLGTRIYRHDSAPQKVTTPYVTWFLVSGVPENNISGAPCSDRDVVQIDIWSDTDAQIVEIANHVRDALDTARAANTVIANTRENDTRLYRIAFQADIISSR